MHAEVQEGKTLLQLAESRNRFLLKEVNELRKERGMREVELEQVSGKVTSLNRDSILGRMVEDDLNSILSVLEDGVESGVVKVRRRDHCSEVSPDWFCVSGKVYYYCARVN